MNGRCCVFQPFDNGPHERRYIDIIEPAIKAAGLEPYRVDRDDGALIPIDSLHEEIRSATACLADISTTNPNVMYELGAAIAGNTPVVIISSSGSEKFPFDIQHRSIIGYSRESSSDFKKLEEDITKRLGAILKNRAVIHKIVTASPVKSTQGLEAHEIAALALIMANRNDSEDGVLPSTIQKDMERAGFTQLASGLALTSLQKNGLVGLKKMQGSGLNDDSWTVYLLTEKGEDWLLDNQDRLELRRQPDATVSRFTSWEGITDDEVPF